MNTEPWHSAAWAIAAALGAGILLAFGTHLQSTAVKGWHRSPSSRVRIPAFLLDRRWLSGTALLGLAIVVQLWSVTLAAVSLVQPLGISALVVSALIRSRLHAPYWNAALLRNVVFCVVGITLFVGTAAQFAGDAVVSDQTAWTLLGISFLVFGGAAAASALRDKIRRTLLIVEAGLLFGIVVTLSKVVLTQPLVWTSGQTQAALSPEILVICCLVLVGATILGTSLVQMSHRTANPETVVASLTVIDPLTAVLLGGLLLGEMQSVPLWALAAMLCAGALAIVGVIGLAKSKHAPHARETAGPRAEGRATER